MESNNSQDAPLGILLIATYWILIGIIILSFFSGNRIPPIVQIISIFLSIFFILLGWGILTLQTWAYYISLAMSISISIVFIFSFLIIMFYALLLILLFAPFLIITIYLIKKSRLFIKIPDRNAFTRCINCKRLIPSDSRLCPYCFKVFEIPEENKKGCKDSNWEERLDKILNN